MAKEQPLTPPEKILEHLDVSSQPLKDSFDVNAAKQRPQFTFGQAFQAKTHPY
jgi:hypothetical protein